jgi:hypothetical protein
MARSKAEHLLRPDLGRKLAKRHRPQLNKLLAKVRLQADFSSHGVAREGVVQSQDQVEMATSYHCRRNNRAVDPVRPTEPCGHSLSRLG